MFYLLFEWLLPWKTYPCFKPEEVGEGCYFPASVFAMDILGNVVEERVWVRKWASRIVLVFLFSVLNPFCRRSRVYRSDAPDHGREDGAPFDVEPRNVLNRLWQRYASADCSRL